MNMQVICPVCQNSRELPQGAEGRKWKCGGCASVHRILIGEGAYSLKTLEEAMPNTVERPEPEMATYAETAMAPDRASAGPKLQTRRDKFRNEAPPAEKRRTTRGTSRRRHR